MNWGYVLGGGTHNPQQMLISRGEIMSDSVPVT